MPEFVATALHENRMETAFQARPPYQRNDYLGWIARAKRDATKEKRLQQMLDELAAGDTYMRMRWNGPKA